MIRLSSILFLLFIYNCCALIEIRAQDSIDSSDWEKINVCQIKFLIPKKLKNQYAKGIDSCVAEFRNGKMRLLIDSGSYGGLYKKTESNLDFKEEFIEIDSKKAQIVTYKDTQKKSKRKFVAGFYVVLYESQNKKMESSAFLYMTIESKNENDLKIAKQIFQSIHFDVYSPRGYTIEQ